MTLSHVQAPPVPAEPPRSAWTRFWPRLLAPVAVLAGSLVVAIVAGNVASVAGAGDDAAGAVATFAASLAIAGFALLIVRRLPAHERRMLRAAKGGGAVPAAGIGVAVGLAAIIASGIVIAVGTAVDPGVEDKLEEISEGLVDTSPPVWTMVLLVVALVVLAPLGEELLFRGVLLRGLAQRMAFIPAAIVSSVIFAAAHLDQYLPYPVWPRTVTLAVIGFLLALAYRARGLPAAIAGHATVNAIAAVALIVEAYR